MIAIMFQPGLSDKPYMRGFPSTSEAMQASAIPWAMQMRAVSMDEPGRLVQTLTGAILGCGGWVLSRGASESGTVSMLFEFERGVCIDIYSILIAAGLELSGSAHMRFTELCQCTRLGPQDCGDDIASVDLEIQTYPATSIREESSPRWA